MKIKVIEKITIVKNGVYRQVRIILKDGEYILQKKRPSSRIWTDIMTSKTMPKIKMKDLR